jgi:uncharacterized protein YggT (Ycf19 family)
MNFDQLLKKFLKFLTVVLWIFFAILFLLWFSQNKEKFFPVRKIQEIPNPVNPFR